MVSSIEHSALSRVQIHSCDSTKIWPNQDWFNFSSIYIFFQLIDLGFKKWRSSYWNWWDVIAIVLYFVGFAMRMANQRIEGRILYAIDLMFFIVRILETFLVDEDLGPYVVMIGRMVSNRSTSESTY